MTLDASFIFEIIGTIAFSISGAVIACQKKMDLFGVAFLGITTAVGGGMIRDIILGNTPPSAFVHPVFIIVALITALIVFIPWVHQMILDNPIYYGRFMLITDSIGLGIFTVNGIIIATRILEEPNYFLFLFVGLSTGVGGGVLRDIMAGDRPYIFVKHFYASASLIGGIATVLCMQFTSLKIASYVGMGLVILLRFMAARFRWSLPKAGQHTEEDLSEETFE